MGLSLSGEVPTFRDFLFAALLADSYIELNTATGERGPLEY